MSWVVSEPVSRHVYILARDRPWTNSGTGASVSINDLRYTIACMIVHDPPCLCPLSSALDAGNPCIPQD